MPFLSLSLYHFRNLQDDKIDLSSKEVYFVGENGQGKTNILEALYYSAYGSSFKTHIDGQIIKYGKKNFAVNSLYNNEKSNTQQIHIAFENNKKIIEKNGKRIRDRKDLINTIPCVLFSHDDMQFTTGAPEVRRFFLDQSLSMYDSLYIDDIRNYKKVLKTRNLILKNKDYFLPTNYYKYHPLRWIYPYLVKYASNYFLSKYIANIKIDGCFYFPLRIVDSIFQHCNHKNVCKQITKMLWAVKNISG